VSKQFGSTPALHDLNLKIEAGECFGFIGPNGAGKSTTMKLIMQMIHPTTGQIKLFNQTIQKDTPHVRNWIGYVPSEVNYPEEFNGLQLLHFAANTRGIPLKDTGVHELAERFQLDLKKRVKDYSHGNRKKLAIIQALLHHPKLIILDEPNSGLDPFMQKVFVDLLKERNEQGTTILYSTHVLSEVEKLCTRVAFIRDGHLLQVTDVASFIQKQSRVIDVLFEQPGDCRATYQLMKLDHLVSYENGVHHIHTDLEINQVLQHFSQMPLKDISIRKPSLEELFFKEYERPQVEEG
jgi:ABC-2 type transport system ATP-binding protein